MKILLFSLSPLLFSRFNFSMREVFPFPVSCLYMPDVYLTLPTTTTCMFSTEKYEKVEKSHNTVHSCETSIHAVIQHAHPTYNSYIISETFKTHSLSFGTKFIYWVLLTSHLINVTTFSSKSPCHKFFEST